MVIRIIQVLFLYTVLYCTIGFHVIVRYGLEEIRKPRDLGCSILSAARMLLQARGFLYCVVSD